MSTNLARPRVIVAMPAYNEGKYIGSVILQARKYADEVVVVDDGSTDHTCDVARLAGATVIRHETNKGKGVAVQSILAEASRKTADVLVLMDADAQHDPEEIPLFLEAITRGSDVVVGTRRASRRKIPAYRYVGQSVLGYFTRVLSGKKLSDTESGYRALSRKAISELTTLKESGFAIEAEMLSVAVERGLKVAEIPISAIYTGDGSTINPVRHGFGVLNRIAVMISEKRPLLFFGIGGSISIVFGAISGIMVARTMLTSQALATGTALIAVLFITVGMLSIFTGVILNVLIKRIDKSR